MTKELRGMEAQTNSVLGMTGNMSNQLAWSKQVAVNGKTKKEHETSQSLVAFKNAMEAKERTNDVRWDLDVQTLISSAKWLQLYGLKKNKMTFSQIFSQIGFQHKEDYVSVLGKIVASRYADGLYHQYRAVSDGKVYNLTAKKSLLLNFANRLTGMIELYKQRMDWLTSESRQVFGVIQEQNISIVLDFGTASLSEFNLCREALSMVLKQQVTQIEKFNLIRVAQDLVPWQEKPVFATKNSIEDATEWLWTLEYLPAVCHTGSTEAILEALFDHTTEAVYYFVVGDIPECAKYLLVQKISRSLCPIHTISFNAREEETVAFLKDLSQLTTGRFHAFAERTDEVLVIGPSLSKNEKATLNSRRLKGRLPLGTGVREDVYLIWRELEEAKNILTQIEKILIEFEKSKSVAEEMDKTEYEPEVKDFVNSREWLQKNGLKAQNLTIPRAFSDCAFRHVNGVVDIKTKPEDESLQTNAETNKKVIHAKYCSNFIHTVLEDGSIIHLHLNKERCKEFENKVKNALHQMEERIQDLKKGSRALFGDVTEDHICILIDVSQSMIYKLPVVKEKIYQLIRRNHSTDDFLQEQFQNKTRFNFVKFDAEAIAWKDRLAEVNEENIEDAILWIKQLQVGTTTNILKALQIAFADRDTQAIYLLTDGRPDQHPNRILDELKLWRNIPVHTISFNCDDTGANQFLHELASSTGGRFHYYHICLTDPDSPKPFECEDIYLVRREIERGEKQLNTVQSFYTGSDLMDLFNGAKNLHDKQPRQTFATIPVTIQVEGQNPSSRARPYSAFEEPASASSEPGMAFSESPTTKKRVLYAEPTKSSMLRTQRYTAKPPEKCQDGKASAERKEQKSPKLEQKIKDESLDIPSAQWLKIHGLAAKRLTIMDALSPTAVSRTTTYVPILDKHVVSKVFDDIFPFAHVSSDKKCVTLLNPQAVDLDAYRKKVQEAIKVYERRLDQIVWKALPQKEKEKFGQTEPVSYVDCKESLLVALANANWPIANQDLLMLEDEILTALTYLQQASDLEIASKEEPQRICPLHICPTKEAKKPKTKIFDYLKGQNVIARSECTGFYYPGTVVKSITSFYALVDFVNGQTEIVPLKFILFIGGATPCPPLQVGDYVFTRIRKPSGEEYYVPGVVIAIPNKADLDDKLYTVLKYNNKKDHCVRNGLIKISHRRYTCSCCYINMTKMMDYLIPNVKVPKHIHRIVADAERQKKSISVGGDWKKKTKKKDRGRVNSKTERCKEWNTTVCDEMFGPRSKRRGNSSSPSFRRKKENTAACKTFPLSFSSSADKICLSSRASDYRPHKDLWSSHYTSMYHQSTSDQPSTYSSSSSSSSSSNTSLSSIEKVEELARRLQQYHIAQRKDNSSSCK
ncbi:von Willebrand factor A domain-containing protein 3B isoform X2 [Pantherophis guttatus]|uniref:von Willebrand factor A domain-containing protein 3B isoform X2 n=1 Tax=Pantherophis guttatus TaxID=94885 RepID=A0A6P9D507_PANGU|nr:von Willebrand factor A domain-containing protein 3B isoform X2 [Pantherophis guttatus]